MVATAGVVYDWSVSAIDRVRTPQNLEHIQGLVSTTPNTSTDHRSATARCDHAQAPWPDVTDRDNLEQCILECGVDPPPNVHPLAEDLSQHSIPHPRNRVRI